MTARRSCGGARRIDADSYLIERRRRGQADIADLRKILVKDDHHL